MLVTSKATSSREVVSPSFGTREIAKVFGSGIPSRISFTPPSKSAALTTLAGIASSQVCESTLVTQSSRSFIAARSGTAARSSITFPSSDQKAAIWRSPGPPWLT